MAYLGKERIYPSCSQMAKVELRACLVRVRVKPFWRSLAYAEDLSEGSVW